MIRLPALFPVEMRGQFWPRMEPTQKRLPKQASAQTPAEKYEEFFVPAIFEQRLAVNMPPAPRIVINRAAGGHDRK